MSTALKRGAWEMAAVVALRMLALVLALTLALMLALAAALFFVDPNALKPLLAERVQRDHQRRLDIPGRISLSLFPSLGVKLGEVSLSARGSDQPFAAARGAHVSLAVLPLLRGQWVVDRVRVEGLRLRVVRSADGRTSIDDLLGRDAAGPASAASPPATPGTGASPPLSFDIAGLTLTDAALDVRDELAGRLVELAGLSLETGRLAPGVASPWKLQTRLRVDAPAVDAELMLAATAAVTLTPLSVQLSGAQASLQGQLPGGTVSARLALPQLDCRAGQVAAQALQIDFSAEQGQRRVQGRVGLAAFSGSGAALQLPGLSGELTASDGPLQAQATLGGALALDTEAARLSSGDTRLKLSGRQGETVIDGTLRAAWQLDLKAATLAVSNWQLDAALPNPRGGALKLQAAGELALGPAPKALQLSAAGVLDASRFKLDLQTARLAPAAWRFSFEVDALDLDRYRDGYSAPPAAAPAVPAASAAAAAPIDLRALQGLDLRGSLRVGQLRAAHMRLAELRADVTAAGGELALRPLQARLYEGSLDGAASVSASASPSTSASASPTATAVPHLAMQARLKDVSLGPLLQDALGKARIEGRGDVVLDLRAQGATVPALMQTLAGDARVALRDGAVQGFNIAQALRSARAVLGRAPAGAAPAGETQRTDFSTLDGTFKLAGGVAHTEDLQAKSPLLRVAVVGDVDLGARRLDCMVQATVVGTLKGQDGPELQALRGQTVPVRLHGPFDAIGYSVDLKGLALGVVREQLETKGEQVKEDLKARARDKLKGLFGN